VLRSDRKLAAFLAFEFASYAFTYGLLFSGPLAQWILQLASPLWFNLRTMLTLAALLTLVSGYVVKSVK
jgi:hypothetical protein